MIKKPTIAILGGAGRTGKFIVANLIRQQYPVKLLLRNYESFTLKHEFIQVIQGDAIDSTAIGHLLQGCTAVISTLGQRKGEPLIASLATENIITAMERYNIQRYIFVAGINIDTPYDKKSPQTEAATMWMKTNFPSIQEDRQNAYSILCKSLIDWTMIRVPMIEFTEGSGKYKINKEDCPGSSISAGDIADFVMKQLNDTQHLKGAPFIAN